MPKINPFLYKNRSRLLAIGVLLILSGLILAFKKWRIEPEETIAGFLCGAGMGLVVVSLGLKSPNGFKN